MKPSLDKKKPEPVPALFIKAHQRRLRFGFVLPRDKKHDPIDMRGHINAAAYVALSLAADWRKR